MTEFEFPAFSRHYVLLPMLLAIALVSSLYFVAEQRRSEAMRISTDIRQRQENMRLLAEVIYQAADAESARYDYLLTRDTAYLSPFDKATIQLNDLLLQLISRYSKDEAERSHLLSAKKLVEKKFAEMMSTLETSRKVKTSMLPLKVNQSDIGLYWMQTIQKEIGSVRDREHEKVYAGIRAWDAENTTSRYVAGAATIFIIMLILTTGALITRDIERRNRAARLLDSEVAERTAELSALSEHLQQATELEKAKLARELHDELGSLLVAIKMDMAQVLKQIDISHPDLQVRWQRIQRALSDGIALKRRVIEELRPTLLDNMGLVAALRWQTEETCGNAGITLDANFPDHEVKLDTAAAIALFRVAQETLTNMVKHARATRVSVLLAISTTELLLKIEDNGIGMAPIRGSVSKSHGLLSMKYRMQAIGGSFHIGSAAPHGTVVTARMPIDSTTNITNFRS